MYTVTDVDGDPPVKSPLTTSGRPTFLDWYCSTVQGLLDWFEVDLGFTELLFIQIDLCVMCVFVLLPSLTLLLPPTGGPVLTSHYNRFQVKGSK